MQGVTDDSSDLWPGVRRPVGAAAARPRRTATGFAARPAPAVACRGRTGPARRTDQGDTMKVDGGFGIAPDALDAAGDQARSLEAAGYDGVWSAETSHDPFFPLLIAAQHTETHRARHRHRGGLRPQPDDPGPDRLGPAGVLEGPVHARPRQPDQAPHHQAVLDAVVAPGAPHARDDPGDPGHLGLLEQRHQARLPGRLLHAHPDDPVLQPRARTRTATPRSSSPPSAS